MSASADDRPVKVILSAVVSDYVEKMEAARKATDETREANKKAAAEAEKVKATWKTVGTTMTAVGGAVLSVGAAMLTMGVNYNAMQQQTRAALSTVLGSAQAANAQMDKLDEFAKTSPFAKTTFIKAQQQMLAFGIETQKVIPYLSAIGDATAAAGGSNQQIEEIAAIMSKISSSSKITAEDLNQFGERGINAAELIGLSMGKTAKQIREEITAGTLDADAALDALVQGMNSKFEGASANVKTTFSGALDRVGRVARPLIRACGTARRCQRRRNARRCAELRCRPSQRVPGSSRAGQGDHRSHHRNDRCCRCCQGRMDSCRTEDGRVHREP